MSHEDREFRVLWARKDTPRRHRIFKTLAAAERLAGHLTNDDDLHWKCDEAHLDCMEPIAVGPSIEERRVLPWHALVTVPRVHTSEEPT